MARYPLRSCAPEMDLDRLLEAIVKRAQFGSQLRKGVTITQFRCPGGVGNVSYFFLIQGRGVASGVGNLGPCTNGRTQFFHLFGKKGSVLFCMDSYEGGSRFIFQHFSHSFEFGAVKKKSKSCRSRKCRKVRLLEAYRRRRHS